MPPRRSSPRKAKKSKPRAMWVWAPATVAPGETLRREVEARAQELINTVFKPKHVRTEPEHPGWNYLTEIVGRWDRLQIGSVGLVRLKSGGANPTNELPMNDPVEQITPRLRRWGNFCELDGAPLRRVVGHAPKENLLDRLDHLHASLRGLLNSPLPSPDARRVRKFVGKAGTNLQPGWAAWF